MKLKILIAYILIILSAVVWQSESFAAPIRIPACNDLEYLFNNCYLTIKAKDLDRLVMYLGFDKPVYLWDQNDSDSLKNAYAACKISNPAFFKNYDQKFFVDVYIQHNVIQKIKRAGQQILDAMKLMERLPDLRQTWRRFESQPLLSLKQSGELKLLAAEISQASEKLNAAGYKDNTTALMSQIRKKLQATDFFYRLRDIEAQTVKIEVSKDGLNRSNALLKNMQMLSSPDGADMEKLQNLYRKVRHRRNSIRIALREESCDRLSTPKIRPEFWDVPVLGSYLEKDLTLERFACAAAMAGDFWSFTRPLLWFLDKWDFGKQFYKLKLESTTLYFTLNLFDFEERRLYPKRHPHKKGQPCFVLRAVKGADGYQEFENAQTGLTKISQLFNGWSQKIQ